MIKRTLYFGNPAYLGKREDQLLIRLAQVEKNPQLPPSFKKEAETTIPIEDIGVVILDHQQITITHGLMDALLGNNVALITCNASHHPVGLMLNLAGNQLQSAKFQAQVEASLPLKKQLWQQTVVAKITNQAYLLRRNGHEVGNMMAWAEQVRSGDPDNLEARAAVYYWKKLMHLVPGFIREREGIPPNNLLNYGYAILRAVIARNLVASGLMPTLGIFHRNQYNHYCLADDIMEPFRPFVDEVVLGIIRQGEDFSELSASIKKQLLGIPTVDIYLDHQKSPLMVGAQRCTASLARCFEGKSRKILYPEFL